MWWGYGHPMWGWGPLFPIMGFIFMIVIIVLVFRLFSGRSGMCGFGRPDEVDDLRKEVRELRGEIDALRKGK
ncbi:MAG: hypothetical protein ACYC7J_20040 [Syntrophales bacterium]